MSAVVSGGAGDPTLGLHPVAGLPEVAEGDDLAALIADHAALADGDVVVIAQKIVSKAEGAVVTLGPGEDEGRARRRLAVEQARRVVADAPFAVVVETAHGLVCANGGIDASNVPEGRLLLLPADPDASARRIRAGLAARTGRTVAVVISDTFGRPWRMGQTDVAIGAAGIAPLRDERGTRDREGRVLDVTEAAIADELAGAADLVRRKGDGVPVVVVRGLAYEPDETAGASALIRPAEQDLFRRGRGGLADALASLRPPPQIGRPPASPYVQPEVTGRPPSAALDRALAAAEGLAGGGVVVRLLDGAPSQGGAAEAEPARILLLPDAAEDPALAIRNATAAGLAAGALVAALLDLDLVAVPRLPAAGEAGADRPGAVVVVAALRAAAHRAPGARPPPEAPVPTARPVGEPPPGGRR